MRYFDLHCDTLFECEKKHLGLTDNGLHVDFNRAPANPYLQCFAAWIPDTLRGEEAFAHFVRLAAVYQEEARKGVFVPVTDRESFQEAERIGRGGILTIEGGAAFGGKLDHIREAASLGVKIATLTWNGANEIGTGIGCDDTAAGLTDFGRKAVSVMEEVGILPDVSHSSLRLFEDLCCCCSGPILATHSNAKKLCGHRRNLTDRQFSEIVRRKGLVGINFYRAFLNNEEEKACMEDIFEHTDYFLSLGGEDCVAMGSDFDGSDIPSDMRGIESVEPLYEVFLRHHYSEALIDKIFYRNAADFMLFHTLQRQKIQI